MMHPVLFDRRALERDAWDRRDAEPSLRQYAETMRLLPAFERCRVLLSRARLHAEVARSCN